MRINALSGVGKFKYLDSTWNKNNAFHVLDILGKKLN